MNEIKPNWKIAAQVSWLHSTWSGQITGLLFILFLITSSIVLVIKGQHLTFDLLVSFLIKYKAIIIPALLLIHFIPVNLFAITKVLQHHYPGFSIQIVRERKQN